MVTLDQEYASCKFPYVRGHPQEILSSLSLRVIKLNTRDTVVKGRTKGGIKMRVFIILLISSLSLVSSSYISNSVHLGIVRFSVTFIE